MPERCTFGRGLGVSGADDLAWVGGFVSPVGPVDRWPTAVRDGVPLSLAAIGRGGSTLCFGALGRVGRLKRVQRVHDSRSDSRIVGIK